jgi:hypothetical protein
MDMAVAIQAFVGDNTTEEVRSLASITLRDIMLAPPQYQSEGLCIPVT